MCTSASASPMGTGSWSTWHGTYAGARSPLRACARVRASRSSSGMKSGPRALGAGRSSGRCAYPASSSSGAGGSMCLHPEPCWGGAGVCTPIRRVRRWRCVASSSATGRWRWPGPWIGRAHARSGVRHIRNAVRSVGSAWYARPSSPGPVFPHLRRQIGSKWHA
jgi:hypothetical protein